MNRSLTVAVAITALFISSLASAQDKTADIDKVFSWATPNTPGCAVALSQHGKLVVRRAYGLAEVERKVPIAPDTMFDVGSVVKQFVAAATLLLVEEGRLSLTEDVRKYIPELPDYGHKITLDHLMTHTSGIRDWDGLIGLTDGKTDALTLTLRQPALNFAPGAEWSYSNSGYVLLKEIVARTSGLPFGEFARKRLFVPLGMKSTAYVRDAASSKDAARAYEKAGAGWKEHALLGNARGGGALLSTAPDLVIWNDALTSGRLGKFVTAKLQEPATLSNGRKLDYARGLYLDTTSRGQLVWHAGSAGAYKSVVGRLPQHGLSIAVACNAGEAADARTRFAARIFDLFVPGTPAGRR